MHLDDIDRFLARWRATLPPSFAPEHVDGFMQRHRAEIDALVLQTLARRGAEGGERPDIPADFLAYDAVTAAQRLLDAQNDSQVVQALMRQVDAHFAQGHSELSVFHNFAVEYIGAAHRGAGVRARLRRHGASGHRRRAAARGDRTSTSSAPPSRSGTTWCAVSSTSPRGGPRMTSA
jgi:hypothetical protein